MGGLNLKIWQNFVGAKNFSYICGGINLYGGVKIYGGVIFIHYFISLETANTQKSEVFLFVNTSGVVTCRYPQTY